MPQIQISSPCCGYLPGRKDGASARGGTWKRENSKILKSFSPSTSAQTHAELFPYAPPGTWAGFIYGESIPASTEGTQFTLHLLMDHFF